MHAGHVSSAIAGRRHRKEQGGTQQIGNLQARVVLAVPIDGHLGHVRVDISARRNFWVRIECATTAFCGFVRLSATTRPSSPEAASRCSRYRKMCCMDEV